MYQTLLEDSSDFDGFDVSAGYVSAFCCVMIMHMLCKAYIFADILHALLWFLCMCLCLIITVPEYCIFYRCKFDSPKNKDVLAILLREVQLANPQFQVCQIRG